MRKKNNSTLKATKRRPQIVIDCSNAAAKRMIAGKTVTVSNARKTDRVVLSSIFENADQERVFAECAAESMSTSAFLKW